MRHISSKERIWIVGSRMSLGSLGLVSREILFRHEPLLLRSGLSQASFIPPVLEIISFLSLWNEVVCIERNVSCKVDQQNEKREKKATKWWSNPDFVVRSITSITRRCWILLVGTLYWSPIFVFALFYVNWIINFWMEGESRSLDLFLKNERSFGSCQYQTYIGGT